MNVSRSGRPTAEILGTLDGHDRLTLRDANLPTDPATLNPDFFSEAHIFTDGQPRSVMGRSETISAVHMPEADVLAGMRLRLARTSRSIQKPFAGVVRDRGNRRGRIDPLGGNLGNRVQSAKPARARAVGARLQEREVRAYRPRPRTFLRFSCQRSLLGALLGRRKVDILMQIDRTWALLIAIATCASIGAAIASQWRYRQRQRTDPKEHASDLRNWEAEGGNLAPGSA